MTQNGPLEPLRVERTKLSAKFRARCRDAKTNRLWWLAVISSASSWPSRSTPCSTLSKSATKPFLQPTQHKKVGNFECSSLFDSWRGEKQHRCQLPGIVQRHEMQTRYQWLGNSTIQMNPFHPDRLTRPIIPSQICLICAGTQFNWSLNARAKQNNSQSVNGWHSQDLTLHALNQCWTSI